MASVHQEVFDQALVSVAQSLGALRPTPVAKLQLLFSPLPALVDAGNNSIRSLNHDQLSSLSQLDFEQQKTIITTFLVCTAHSPTVDTNLIAFLGVCFLVCVCVLDSSQTSNSVGIGQVSRCQWRSIPRVDHSSIVELPSITVGGIRCQRHIDRWIVARCSGARRAVERIGIVWSTHCTGHHLVLYSCST
jgi:hypothetical protein